MTLVQLAREYRVHYGPVIPLKALGKEPPQGFKWKEYDGSEDETLFANAPVNIAVRLDRLVDFDLDSPEAARLARAGMLSPTPVFGRPSKPGSHWIYQAPEGVRYEKFSDPDPRPGEEKILLELRTGPDKYTRFPGSTHSNGERVEWELPREAAPAVINNPALVARHIAGASLIVRCWESGHRDELEAAISGALLRDGWSEAQIAELIQRIAIAAKDSDAHTRGKKAAYARRAISDPTGEKRIFGWPRVAEIMGQKRADKVHEWLCGHLLKERATDDIEKLIDELNGSYALVNVVGKERVLEEVTEPTTGHVRYALKTVADLRSKLANRRVVVGGREKNAADVWLAHRKRRDLKGIVFAPYRPGRPVEYPLYYNSFRGWPIEPREGDCSRYLGHLKDIICKGNEQHYQWLLGVMAHAIQEPAVKLGISVVLRGKQGTGKGKALEWFGKLFGQHFIQLTQSQQLLGRFNAHLEEKLLIFADEAFWAGDKEAEGHLKALVTERESVVERKGVDAVRTNNYARLFIASNHDWVVPAGTEERRFAVFDVSDARMQDHAYFAAIDDEMVNGGLQALMHYLLHFDYSQINIRAIPTTTALLEQKEASLGPIVRWWKDGLWRGSLGASDTRWPEGELIPVGQLHEMCLEETKKLGERRMMPMNVFAKRLRDFFPDPKVVRPSNKGTGDRKRSYLIPPLDECRQRYDALMGVRSDWPDVSIPDRDPPKF